MLAKWWYFVGTSLAELIDSHESVFIQPFLPGLVYCSFLLSSALLILSQVLRVIPVNTAIAQCAIEYGSKLHQYNVEFNFCMLGIQFHEQIYDMESPIKPEHKQYTSISSISPTFLRPSHIPLLTH